MRALRVLALGLLSACIRLLQVAGTPAEGGELLVGVGRADVTGPVADVTFMVSRLLRNPPAARLRAPALNPSAVVAAACAGVRQARPTRGGNPHAAARACLRVRRARRPLQPGGVRLAGRVHGESAGHHACGEAAARVRPRSPLLQSSSSPHRDQPWVLAAETLLSNPRRRFDELYTERNLVISGIHTHSAPGPMPSVSSYKPHLVTISYPKAARRWR